MLNCFVLFLHFFSYTGLQETGHYFDHLYVHFYNNFCHTGNAQYFLRSLKQWLAFSHKAKPKGPLIFIGLPAGTGGASSPQYYRPPDQLKAMYEASVFYILKDPPQSHPGFDYYVCY